MDPGDGGAQGLLDLVVGEVVHGGWCVAREPGDTAEAGGRVVFGFGGNDGDCATYRGRIVSVPETGGAPRP